MDEPSNVYLYLEGSLTIVSLLNNWHSFYSIIGSAAGALTGLMFVVITLIAGDRSQRTRTESGSIAAFGTPTVVHFCASLLVAATLSAPWQALWHASLLLGLSGLGGVAYIIVVIQRTRQQTKYQPVMEDWLWHTIFPLLAYLALITAAIMLPDNPVPALFIIGSATVLFLFIGIHNAWDTVTYLTIERIHQENEGQMSEHDEA